MVSTLLCYYLHLEHVIMSDMTLDVNDSTYLDMISIEIIYSICEYLDLNSMKKLQRIYGWIATDTYFRFLLEVKIFGEHKNPVRYIKKYVKRNGVDEIAKIMRKAFKLQVGNMERTLIYLIYTIPRTSLIKNKEFIDEFIDMYTKYLSPSSEYFNDRMKIYAENVYNENNYSKIKQWIESDS